MSYRKEIKNGAKLTIRLNRFPSQTLSTNAHHASLHADVVGCIRLDPFHLGFFMDCTGFSMTREFAQLAQLLLCNPDSERDYISDD